MANSIIGTLVYKITGDSTALEQSLENSQSKISKTGESITKLGQRAASVATTVFSGVFIKSILAASSRVEELESKFNTVFSGIEATADAWAREYAEATNRGVTSTKEFLATQQDLRTGYGDSAEAAMKYAQAVVGVTNDLASFSNVPVEEAMAAINSGLSGQFEALRRLGVGLNTNIINQSEYAKSINKTWDEMSNLEKQEAVLSGIMNQSKNAIHQNVEVWTEYDYTLGDAALTSDSFANSSQGLTQRLDDLKAELGDSILPLATDVIGVAVEAVEAFNAWDDTAQTLTVALLAFGAAMTAIGGPVGAVVGALGALLVVFSNNKDAVDELKDSTDKLSSASNSYNEYTKKLCTNVSELTENERLLLEIRQEQAKLEAQSALSSAKIAYEDAQKALKKHNIELEKSQGVFNAYSLAYKNGLDAVEKKLDEYDSKTEKLTVAEEAEYEALMEIHTKYWRSSEEGFISSTKNMAAAELERLTELQSYETEYDAARASLISSIATALNAGVINVETLELLYPDLTDEVQKCAQALNEETSAIEDQTEATSKAITATNSWRQARAEQMADLLEEQKDYKAAAEIRIGLIEEEKKASLQALAESSGVIQEGETLSDEALQAALATSKEFKAEYEALVAYYTALIEEERSKETDYINEQLQKQKDAEDELEKTREENAKAWMDKLDEQSISARENQAATLESEGKIKEAYQIRRDLINEEEATELEALQEKIAANEATAEEIDYLHTYYARKRALLKKEETAAYKAQLDEQKNAEDALAKTRQSNAEAWDKKLQEQNISIRENEAAEYESAGDLQSAYEIRYALLDEEEKRELEALQEKIDANEATEEDKTKLQEYYSNKRTELEEEETEANLALIKKEEDAEEDLEKTRQTNAQTYTDKLLQQKIASDEATASELESLGKVQEAYELRLRLIDEEEARELESLQKLIDANEATEEDKTKLQEYYSNKRTELEEEETELALEQLEEKLKEQNEALASFFSELKSLSVDIGSAIVDLYSTMTDNAEAEIDRQTQAKLEALGLADQTEKEKLEEEYKAAVEAGDMELAQEKQKSLQKLQIEEEADAQKAKLQREQAERERSLKIYTTTLDMLSAVVKYLADPGGWAGVALSAAAATTGALQLAAIKAEALPSFDVGANYVPEDMLAVVHQGETILPEPMAESVRKGDAVLGNAQGIQITIINNTSAEVNAQEVGTDEQREVRITIGQVVQSQIESGRYDSAMGRRYGLRRIGKNV